MPKGRKGYKIKRYSALYPSRRSNASLVLRTIATVAVVCILGFVGWNAYGPVMDYFSGTLAASVRARQEAEEASSASSLEATIPTEEEELSREAEMPLEIRGIYFPPSIISNEINLNAALALLEDTEINAVLFDLKDASGRLFYYSSQSRIEAEKVQASAPMDLRALCVKLTEKNLIPIGRMYAFADPIGASKISGAGIKYMSTEMLWLDDSPENGGKAWMNPYSMAAQSYLTELATESITLGVRSILFDGFSFPTGYGQEFANLGSGATTSNRGETLRTFLAQITQQIEAAGGNCSLYISGTSALGNSDVYFGGNPLGLVGKHITLGAMPAQFGDKFTGMNSIVEKPILNPYTTVRTLLGSLTTPLKDKHVTALVQGYTATGSLTNNKVYTAEDIREQLRALKDSGINSYILYSPGGNYPAAG